MMSHIRSVNSSTNDDFQLGGRSSHSFAFSKSIPQKSLVFSSKSTAKKAVPTDHGAASSDQHVLSWEDLPQWMQTDPYIRSGYRPQLDSYSACFQSVFYLHNESVNIWSHLIPALFYFLAPICADDGVLYNANQLSKADIAVIQLYIAGCVACLIFSVRTCLFFLRLMEIMKQINLAHKWIGLLPHRCCTFGTSSATLRQTGLLGHNTQHSCMCYYVYICRSLWQAKPPSFLYITFHDIDYSCNICKYVGSAIRRATSSDSKVRSFPLVLQNEEVWRLCI